MTFGKFYDLIFENQDKFADFGDDWHDYIVYTDSFSKEELKEAIAFFGLSYSFPIKNKIIKLNKGQEEIWLEYDGDDEFIVWAKSEDDILSTIYSMQDYQILQLVGIDEDDIYIGAQESTLRDIKEHPGSVYHYTTEEKREAIQKSGGMNGSYGTGLTNRSSHGIFTSSDPEEHAVGTYGDVCLELNLTEFMKANNLPKLDISLEPEVLETELQNLLLYKLELPNENEASQDMSAFTLIIHHDIPLKYIRRLD